MPHPLRKAGSSSKKSHQRPIANSTPSLLPPSSRLGWRVANEKSPNPNPFLLRMPVIAVFSLVVGALFAVMGRDLAEDSAAFVFLIFLYSVLVFLITMAVIRGIRLFTDGLSSGRDLREHLRKNPPSTQKDPPTSDDNSS